MAPPGTIIAMESITDQPVIRDYMEFSGIPPSAMAVRLAEFRHANRQEF